MIKNKAASKMLGNLFYLCPLLIGINQFERRVLSICLQFFPKHAQTT